MPSSPRLRPAVGLFLLALWGAALPACAPRSTQASTETYGQAPPVPTTALGRWWRSLARAEVRLTRDEGGLLLVESGSRKPERVYQTWKEAGGTVREGYWEDDVAKPVTDAVRQWVEGRIHEAEQTPPPPPPPPIPPQPPTPPERVAFAPGEAGAAAFGQVAQDPRLLAITGDPVVLAPRAKGTFHTWVAGEPKGWMHGTLGAGAAADLTLTLSGPKGQVRLHAKGERRGTTWTFSTLDLQPGGPSLNLLRP